MMDLFEFAHARRRDPGTSHDAAASVDVTPLEMAVVGALKSNPCGLTSFEIADILRLSLVTVSPRLRPLVDKGLVADSGTKRPGPNNMLRIVWQLRKRQ